MQSYRFASLTLLLYLSADYPQLSGVHNPLPDQPAVAVGGQALHHAGAEHHADGRGAAGHVLPRRPHHRHAARQGEAAGQEGDDAGRQEVPLRRHVRTEEKEPQKRGTHMIPNNESCDLSCIDTYLRVVLLSLLHFLLICDVKLGSFIYRQINLVRDIK